MYIDLTMEISGRTPTFPGDPATKIEPVATIERDGWNEKKVELRTHFGTHIDAPYHMLADGKKLDEFPIETFIGEAVVVDARGISEIKKEHLPELGSADMVLFYTGHSEKAFDADYFTNNPVLLEETAEELASHGVKIVGIDSFTPDNEPYNVHKILFAKDILILENLMNLEKIGKKCKLYIAPLNLKAADGAPARVIAEIYS